MMARLTRSSLISCADSAIDGCQSIAPADTVPRMNQDKPFIGITAGEIINKDEPWAPITHGQSVTYVQAIVQAGGIPVILPLVDDEQVNRAMYDRCDAILFAGGNDIDPSMFGEELHPTVKDISKLRDAVELRLMRWSVEDDRPILGVCRGMELLNIVRGGDLYQDIPSMLPDATDHNLSSAAKDIEHIAHVLRLEPGSRFAGIIGKGTLGTNTHHHQAIREVGEGLRAVAWSEDGVIEAIEAEGKPFVIGVQSHPESMWPKAAPEWRNFFQEFVDQAAAGRSGRELSLTGQTGQ